jgi:hypothetical protein
MRHYPVPGYRILRVSFGTYTSLARSKSLPLKRTKVLQKKYKFLDLNIILIQLGLAHKEDLMPIAISRGDHQPPGTSSGTPHALIGVGMPQWLRPLDV